jgi:NTE family protein
VAPVTIGDHVYMDGGLAGTNVDGAAGYGRILAVAPGVGPKTQLELAMLRAHGSKVLVIAPNDEAEAARGQDPLDVSRIRPSASVWYRQTSAVIGEVRELLQR